MADLFLGQTCTEAYRFISAGTAHTFTFSWQPDKVVFNNITKWVATAGNLPVSIWWRDETLSGDSQQMVVIDSSAGASFNFKTEATNGFTVANTAGGVASYFKLISGVTQADPCVITTTTAHGYQTDQQVRITDLGNVGPSVADRGMSQLNNNQYIITVLTSTTFSLRDVITDEPIDSTAFTAWVSGGRVDMVTRVISLNNPAQFPYLVTPYSPTPFAYDPILYKLTAGTAVMGSDSDRFVIEAYKFGSYTDLGDLVT
jgi:hypothetical protein